MEYLTPLDCQLVQVNYEQHKLQLETLELFHSKYGT